MVEAHRQSTGLSRLSSSSFLPQDRVAQFARMSPRELLEQTQKAAGDKLLSSWHTELKELGEELEKHISVCLQDAHRVESLPDVSFILPDAQ